MIPWLPAQLRLVIMTSVLLLIAACGGSSDDATPAGTGAAATETATPAPTPTATATPAEPEPMIVSSSGDTAGGQELSLAIPPDALPAGVAASDISIEAITADDLAVSVDGASVVAGYRLLPDGLELSEPATVTLRMPSDGLTGVGRAGGLALIHLGADGLSPVGDVTVGLDEDGTTLILETTISHFSDLAALQVGFFTVETVVAKHVFKVGETFGAGVHVRPSGARFSVSSDGPGTSYRVDSVFIDGLWTGAPPAITPNMVGDRPSYAALGAEYAGNELFTCAEETGIGVSVAYHVQIGYGFERTIKNDDGSTTTEIAAVFGLTTIDLVDPEPIDCVLVPPIQADQFDVGEETVTQYTLDVSAEDGFSFAWAGPDCGTVDATNQSVMTWTHSTEDCEHTAEDHATTTISVVVTSADLKVRCVYQGAATGFGELCEDVE